MEPFKPVIPDFITVHLGKPQQDAPNIQMPFIEYIKNVASSEIYPTWPENAIRANVLAQISFALNRIYTQHYRSQGYDFDITNSTQFDQYFVKDREIFENIGRIVDEIFNDYVVRQGNIEPLFTQYCNGTTVTCDGLSQWGTVDLAKKGLTPYEILQKYYGDDIDIVFNAPVQSFKETYPGYPLELGSRGNLQKILQVSLNRISKNYPAIPKIDPVDGNFGVETEAAVKEFQKIFNLNPTGIVDKATWYKIVRIFNSVTKISELDAEGVKYKDIEPILPLSLKEGDEGMEVQYIQFYLNAIAYFNNNIPLETVNGIFGPETKQQVIAFQREYGLPETGIVNRDVWGKLDSLYKEFVKTITDISELEEFPYPGYIISKGMRGPNVERIQKLLIAISDVYPEIPKTIDTGYFGDLTKNAVIAFQKKYGLQSKGLVGALTWTKLQQVYSQLKAEGKITS